MQLVKIEAIVDESLVDQTVAALREASSADPERRSRVWVHDLYCLETRRRTTPDSPLTRGRAG